MAGQDADQGDVLEWTVSGMDCASCAGKVRDAVRRLPGVRDVEVTIMSERLKLVLDAGATQRETVEAVVRSLGYGIAPRGLAATRTPFVLPGEGAAVLEPCGEACDGACGTGSTGVDLPLATADGPGDGPAAAGSGWLATAKGRLVVLTGLLLALAWGAEAAVPHDIGSWVFVLACLIGLLPIARRAGAALALGQPFTIESLMTLAAGGALVIGAAEEAAMVVFLFAVGEVLEGVAATRARDGIRALARLVPRTARLEHEGAVVEVPADRLRPGQILRVAAGDGIPADGEIIEGSGGVDESPVTGESVPVARGPGDPVLAGTINTEAALRIRVTRTAQDNTIARIIRLVELAEESRAPTERFIDRFSRWYMPLILALSVAVMLVPPLGFGQPWETWIYRGLALMLIGCPCALVISVPASVASALSAGARRGLLMKGGSVIEAAAKIGQVAFDKTGTLTSGRPDVVEVVPLQGETVASVLAAAGAVESGSSHPLAAAILRHAAGAGVAVAPAQAARALAGRGMEAVVAGQRTWVASPAFAAAEGALAEGDLARVSALEGEGKTVAVVFRAGGALGLITLRDEPRADAAEAVRQLAALGVRSTILTGDNPRAAAAVAHRLGTDFRAGLLPGDKLAAIRELDSDGGVMMIGDGINDAPALKAARVGVAMGSGTDVALETADAAILRNRLTDVPAQIRLARATMTNIRQNVLLALGLKGLFLVTSILGVTGLWMAIVADTGATVLVTANALRLLRFDPEARA